MHRLVFLTLVLAVAPSPPGSFTTAKKRALEVEAGHQRTLYCDCSFNMNKQVDLDSCDYEPRDLFTGSGDLNPRMDRVEWEHVVTAHRMGKHRQCWKAPETYEACLKPNGKVRSSRDCCRFADPEFRAMENDLHNLWPVVGELNGDRSNREIGFVYAERRHYGNCDFEVGNNVVEVDKSIRGEMARTYLYMESTWGQTLTEEEKFRYVEWNEADPPTQWEIDRDARIAKIQGNHNPWIVNHPRVHNGKLCKPRSQCLKVCRTSQACGDGCISKSKTCSKGPGGACNQDTVCPR